MYALVLIVFSLVFVDNWPQWRGPRGQGVSEEKNLPLEWSPTKNIKWKTPIAGRGHSSPIVWGNRLFLTTSIEGAVIPGAKVTIQQPATGLARAVVTSSEGFYEVRFDRTAD